MFWKNRFKTGILGKYLYTSGKTGIEKRRFPLTIFSTTCNCFISFYRCYVGVVFISF